MSARKILPALLLILAVWLVVGCGSSSSDPLTKAAFLEQGNEICEEATKQRDEDLKAATEASDESGGTEEMESFVDTALESVEDMAGNLGDLNPPAAQKKEAEALVSSLDKEVEQLQATPEDAMSEKAFRGSNAAAQSAGLPSCAI